MSYAFSGGMPGYLDTLRRRFQPGLGGVQQLPMINGMPDRMKGPPQYGGISPVQQPVAMGGIAFEGGMPGRPYKPGMPGYGGSGPMGFPNPLAQFRPYMSGSNPMGGRRKNGMGLIRQY